MGYHSNRELAIPSPIIIFLQLIKINFTINYKLTYNKSLNFNILIV
jgi:hypothetical protein